MLLNRIMIVFNSRLLRFKGMKGSLFPINRVLCFDLSAIKGYGNNEWVSSPKLEHANSLQQWRNNNRTKKHHGHSSSEPHRFTRVIIPSVIDKCCRINKPVIETPYILSAPHISLMVEKLSKIGTWSIWRTWGNMVARNLKLKL